MVIKTTLASSARLNDFVDGDTMKTMLIEERQRCFDYFFF